MSDTRDEAEQELVDAVIASGMEDSLAVSRSLYLPMRAKDRSTEAHDIVLPFFVFLSSSPISPTHTIIRPCPRGRAQSIRRARRSTG